MLRTLTAMLAVAGIAIGAAAPKQAKADDLDVLIGILAGATALAIIADAVTDNRVYVAPRYYTPRYVAPRYYAPRYVAPRYYAPRVYVAPRVHVPYYRPVIRPPVYVYRPAPVIRRPVIVDRRTVVRRPAIVDRRTVVRRDVPERRAITRVDRSGHHYWNRDRQRMAVRPGEYDPERFRPRAERIRPRTDRPAADRVERAADRRDRYEGR
jgi:hypothetical protein